MADKADDISWFALKVLHSRVFKVESLLKELGLEVYLPTEIVMRERPDGEREKVRRAVVPSLVFVKGTAARVVGAISLMHQRGLGGTVYTREQADGRRVPAAIPPREMEMFILISSSGEKGLEYFDSANLKLDVGQRVRVTGGIFKGSEGYIKRIKGNRRFVVSINGLCAVATPYIPVAFLQRIDDRGNPINS